MAYYKCKMCGGNLSISDDVKITECEYCGTEQTIPSVKDENLQGLFNRANVLRMKSEFDRAEEIYEKILLADATEAEAYWGIVLCRYGIEYVEDPKTYKRIPTCHRTSFEAIAADEDYKMALQYADVVQRSIYEAEAKAIDAIQKNILAISQKEAPYDVFICYKETDEAGRRTMDSSISNDIYYQLTQEGFKVFYAAITLEDKLGTEYEPYIFSALNSAKVMLVVGTKPEHFNAVWVKNEWSRYLKLMKEDRSRLLIPCYKDMDAYELPEEFAHLQAQDMSKIGFINDVVRGIKKLLKGADDKPVETVQSTQSALGPTVDALLKRAFMSLEDEEWQKADEFCEQALNMDAENALAYVGKLRAQLKIAHQEDMQEHAAQFFDNKNYEKAVRFADANLKGELESYCTIFLKEQEEQRIRQNEAIYNNALKLMQDAGVESQLIEAIEKFQSIRKYKDSEVKVEECKRLLEKAQIKAFIDDAENRLENAYTEVQITEVINSIKKSKNIPDIEAFIEHCKNVYAERKTIALNFWQEYKIIRERWHEEFDVIAKYKDEVSKNFDRLGAINSDLNAIEILKGKMSEIEEKVNSKAIEVEELQKKLDKVKTEIDGLGLFAMAAKKEANAKYDAINKVYSSKKDVLQKLNDKLSSQKAELSKYESESELIKEKENLESKNNTLLAQIDMLEKGNVELNDLTSESKNKWLEPKYLAALLTTDKDTYADVITDVVIIPTIRVIKADKKLLNIALNSPFYPYLDEDFKKTVSNKAPEIDFEAIYFQACQVLEYPRNSEELEWAKLQFESISGYKDANQKSIECSKMLANI